MPLEYRVRSSPERTRARPSGREDLPPRSWPRRPRPEITLPTPVIVVSDAVGSYFPEFNRSALEMIKAQGGIFGWVAASTAVIDAIA